MFLIYTSSKQLIAYLKNRLETYVLKMMNILQNLSEWDAVS